MTPALRERLYEHRLVRQSELFELAALLDTYDLTPDAGPLRGPVRDRPKSYAKTARSSCNAAQFGNARSENVFTVRYDHVR